MVRPIAACAQPLFLGALSLLVLNDHVLKAWEGLPSLFRGKLSDAAGLFVIVPLLCTLLRARTRGGVWIVALVAATLFALVKTSELASHFYERLFWFVRAKNVVDPTDLWTLPMAALGALFTIRQGQRPLENASRARAGALLATPFCIATSASPPPPCDPGAASVGLGRCAEALSPPRANFVANMGEAPIQVRIRDYGEASCNAAYEDRCKLPPMVGEQVQSVPAREAIALASAPHRSGAYRLYTFSIGAAYPTVVLCARDGTHNVPRSAEDIYEANITSRNGLPSGVVFSPDHEAFAELYGYGALCEDSSP